MDQVVTFKELIDSIEKSTDINILEATGRGDTIATIRHCAYHIIYFNYHYDSSSLIKSLFFKSQHGGISYGVHKIDKALLSSRNNATKNIYNMIKDGLVKDGLWDKRLVLK